MEREPSLRGVARIVGMVGLCAGAVYVLYLTRGVVKILVIATLTAMVLGPLVDALQRMRLPRTWAIVAVYAGCALAVVAVGVLVAPSVGGQVSQLSREAQRRVGELRADPAVRRYDGRYHVSERLEAQLRA